MAIKVVLLMAILAVWTTSVVAPIPGLSSIPSLSEIFSAGTGLDETTPEPETIEKSKSADAAVGASGAVAFDKGIHLSNPKLGRLDANLDISASKALGASKGIAETESKNPEERPVVILFPTPPPQQLPVQQLPPQQFRPPQFVQPAPRPMLLPPPPQPAAPCTHGHEPQHFNVHNQNNRPQY